MTIQQFIETAIEGGWSATQSTTIREMMTFGGIEQLIKTVVLDPKAWEAVGKVKGWDRKVTMMWEDLDLHIRGCRFIGGLLEYPYHEGGAVTLEIEQWKLVFHDMVTDLCEGVTLEEFVATL